MTDVEAVTSAGETSSVMESTFLTVSRAATALVGESISRIPGPPTGPSLKSLPLTLDHVPAQNSPKALPALVTFAVPL